jgi:cytochrome c-type biogenesis protein CcmH/NrfG
MTKPKNAPSGQYVSKQTFWLVSLLALAVGFFGGVIFTLYRSQSTVIPGQTAAIGPQTSAGAPQADLSGMIAGLEVETQKNPQNVQAWIQLGDSYFDANQYEKSIRAYRRALELDPKNANVWTDMGVMYRRNGQPQEAIKAFDQAAKVDPKHEVSRLNKGVVLLHDLKDPQGALQAWEELLAINPLAVAPGGQTVDELVTQLKKSLAQQPPAGNK